MESLYVEVALKLATIYKSNAMRYKSTWRVSA